MLDKDIRFLKGVGPARADLLGRLGITTVGDLLLHLPRTWHDRRMNVSIASLLPGSSTTVTGRIVHTAERRISRGRRLFQAVLSDGTGTITLTFFGQKYIRSRLLSDTLVRATGKVEQYGGLSMTHPELEFPDTSPGSIGEGSVASVYPLTSGISQLILRKLIYQALKETESGLPGILPEHVLVSGGWKSRWDLFRSVHRPSSPEMGRKARKMLALEELYLYQLLLRKVRSRADSLRGVRLDFSSVETFERFSRSLPFELTDAQIRVTGELLKGLASDTPMRRLLQGDVGCGKTVAAAAACYACCSSGKLSVVLAPTEVLAAQHETSFSRFLNPLGIECRILTGGTSSRERRELLELLQAGEVDLLVGTHAILEEDVLLPELGLLVVDEQHKFGVSQRETLLAHRNPRPHMLIMSATPIPRTLAMTFYGDLDLSVIDDMPPGRGRTRTEIVRRNDRKRIFDFLGERLKAGERAFVVYPLREASGSQDLYDAKTAWEVLRSGPLGSFGVGLLYGTMKPSEKLGVTDRFASGEISVLVSTTVVEVGLDVPEATVMIVANAERFGLSQLHQLRGRIGRGGKDAWCFLVTGDEADGRGIARMETLASTTDGFVIAEKDLELRGPGQVIGTRQHGLPEFRIADLFTDADLVAKALELAEDMRTDEYPESEIAWRFGSISLPGI